MDQKICKSCNKLKTIPEFLKDKNRKNGHKGICKICHAARDRSRKRVDGIVPCEFVTPEQYDQMLTEQSFKCWICKQESPLAVDHCHKTGKARGLLCRSCNLGLGYFQDDLCKLAIAMDYLLHQ